MRTRRSSAWGFTLLELLVVMVIVGLLAAYVPGEHGDYELLSLGKDRQAGGAGEAAEITSW